MSNLVEQLKFYEQIPMPGGLLERFVLKHGKLYPFRTRPKGYKLGRKHECFRNAAISALAGKGHYVEGFGLVRGLIPILHAWISDDNGNAIDLTWKDGQLEGVEYYGVQFSLTELTEQLLSRELYGLFDSPRGLNIPLMQKMDPELIEAAFAAHKRRIG